MNEWIVCRNGLLLLGSSSPFGAQYSHLTSHNCCTDNMTNIRRLLLIKRKTRNLFKDNKNITRLQTSIHLLTRKCLLRVFLCFHCTVNLCFVLQLIIVFSLFMQLPNSIYGYWVHKLPIRLYVPQAAWKEVAFFRKAIIIYRGKTDKTMWYIHLTFTYTNGMVKIPPRVGGKRNSLSYILRNLS